MRPDPTDGIALRNQMLNEMESQNGLARVITLRHPCLSPALWRERLFALGYPLPLPAANSLRSRFSI